MTFRLTLTLFLLAASAGPSTEAALAADQGPRHHAQGHYAVAAATYEVASGDELLAIAERFEIPLADL